MFLGESKNKKEQKTCSFTGGGRWIRTIEVRDNRFTVCPLWPLGNSSALTTSFSIHDYTDCVNKICNIFFHFEYILSTNVLSGGYSLGKSFIENDISSENTDKISVKEEKMLNRVLKNYNFKVISLSKARSAYKVTTETGAVCLKKMKHGAHKAKNGYILVEELSKHGFKNTAAYIKTKKDNYFVKYKSFIFYASQWIDGKECNFKNLDEVLSCIKLLAEFHLASEKINVGDLKINNNLKNWHKIFNSNLYDLERFKKIIDNKKIKNDFDFLYYNCIDDYYSRGIFSLNILNNSEYYNLSKTANENRTLCHDSFYYQNIIKKDNSLYLIDLDSIIIDLHINDLGKFIRRLMFKKEYSWCFDIALKLINAYSSLCPLSKSELEVMLALIIFPHKFWKLGKKRYLKNKNWREAKYTHKLNNIVKFNDLQQNFLENYTDYLKDFYQK